jgi:hypothetical protein
MKPYFHLMVAVGVILSLWLVGLAMTGPNPLDISGGKILRIHCNQARQVASVVIGAFNAPEDTGHRAELKDWGLTSADKAHAIQEFEMLISNCQH